MTDKDYVNFMNDRNNSHCCDRCPENNGFDSWPGNRLPCGQFHCWVDMHCEDDAQDE